MIGNETLKGWLDAPETEHIEFKEAKRQFNFRELCEYCVALANEGGGSLVLGVADARPRKVVGTAAFLSLTKTRRQLLDCLHFRVDADELVFDGKRVVVFTVPSRPTGLPFHYHGSYLMRSGDGLVAMTPEHLKRIFAESEPDYSAMICPGADLENLAPEAISAFRAMWARKSGNSALLQLAPERLLEDAELVMGEEVTYAALILLGDRKALSKYLAQAEVVFEYRSSDAAGPAQQRVEYRKGFLLFADSLWETIAARNDMQHFQQGLFVYHIPTFGEAVVREALLNAVAHRDYRMGESVFVRQFPRRIEVISPGGFPPGITAENALYRQSPRNRRIAETFARCGLVERAGQGLNRMFEECVRQAKQLPDFAGTDDYQVFVALHGNVQDPAFLQFLEQIGNERLRDFATDDFLLLDMMRREARIPAELRQRIRRLVDLGVAERVGQGRGTRYILSRRFYELADARGEYTRQRRLDRETNKHLLMSHIKRNQQVGSPLRDLCQVLPNESRATVQALLQALRQEGLIHHVGRTKAARWYPGPHPDE
jgi:ATP-dependent DNA helicase RecG